MGLHVSEVVGIATFPPPPLCFTCNNSFSGGGAFCIHQWQVVHDLTKSVHLSETLAVLHQMAGSAVINIEGHDLCGNFNFLKRSFTTAAWRPAQARALPWQCARTLWMVIKAVSLLWLFQTDCGTLFYRQDLSQGTIQVKKREGRYLFSF